MLISSAYFLVTKFTYRQIFAFVMSFNCLAYWAILSFLSITTGFLAKKLRAKPKFERYRSNSSGDFSSIVIEDNDKILLPNRYQTDNLDVSVDSSTENFYVTDNDNKNIVLRYISSILSWLAWFVFSLIPTSFSSFNMLPLPAAMFLTFLVLCIRFYISLRANCPIYVKKKRAEHKLYKKIISTMLQIHPKKVISGFIALIILALLVNSITYKSCVNDHVDARSGIAYGGGAGKNMYYYSSAFTRYLTMDKVCPPGRPCHVYATLPFDTSSSVFINVHTHVDVTQITINYDTEDNYIASGVLKQNVVSSYYVSPSDYDTIGDRNIHNVLLSNLIPETDYIIEIYYDGQSQYRANYTTLPSEDSQSSYNLVYGGDMGVSNAALNIADILEEKDPMAIIFGGDLAYDDGEPYCYYTMDIALDTLQEAIFNPMERLVPIILAVGNHDVGYDSMADIKTVATENGPSYYNGFAQHLPEDEDGNVLQQVPTITQRKTYHAHKIGNMLNLALDASYVESYTGEQLDWIKSMSEQYSNYTKIAIYHDPLVTPLKPQDENPNVLGGGQLWLDAFDTYNFMAVFEHHTHTLKRTFPLRNMTVNENGTIYFGDGDWGVTPSQFDYEANNSNSTHIYALYGAKNHVWVVNVHQGNGSIVYNPIGIDGVSLERPTKQDMNKYSNMSFDNDNEL